MIVAQYETVPCWQCRRCRTGRLFACGPARTCKCECRTTEQQVQCDRCGAKDAVTSRLFKGRELAMYGKRFELMHSRAWLPLPGLTIQTEHAQRVMAGF